MNRLLLPLIFYLAASSCLAKASTFISDGPDFAGGLYFPDMKSTSTRKPAVVFHFGQFTGTFEKTTLTNVVRKLGGQISKRGHDGNLAYRLCYSLVYRHETQRIWVIADDEMGGSDHMVTSISAEGSSAGAPVPSNCPVLPARYGAFSLGSGVRLSMTPNALIQILGMPSGKKGDFIGKGGIIGYAYNQPPDLTDPALGKRAASLAKDGFTTFNTLFAQSADGKVTALSASRTTSN